MKRADLTTAMVLRAVATYGVHAWEVLTDTYPPKLVLAAMQREVDANRLDYGVALRRPFLTAEGRAALEVPSGLSRESNDGSSERPTGEQA